MTARGLCVVAVLAALVAATPAGARLLDVGSIDDAAGDGSPDITRISVGSNSRAVTFIVVLANKTELAENEAVAVFIDSDLNQDTGLEGFEFALAITHTNVVLLKWDGASLVDAESETLYGYSFKGFRLAVDREELGLTSGTLRFGVLTLPAETGDGAPDDSLAEYVLANAPLALRVVKFSAPKTVAAGKRFTTGLQVHRSDLNEVSSAGLVRCTAKFGARAVKVAAAFPADTATCSGVVPKAAKGKTLKVTTTFDLDGARVTRTASIKVK